MKVRFKMATLLVQDIVRDVSRVVEEVLQNRNTSDMSIVDRITLSLSQCSAALGELLNEVLLSSNGSSLSQADVNSLRDLHICVSQLFVQWESRLQQHSPQPRVGRPRVSLNVPMVGLLCLLISVSHNVCY